MKYFFLFIVCFIISQFGFSQSDNCATAPTLTIGAVCSAPLAGTSLGATQSIPGCAGNADDDVWYKFVANATSHSIQVTPSAGYNAVVEVFSGTCASFISLNCEDGGLAGVSENMLLTGLTIGNTYYMRIYHYSAGSGTNTFTTCISNAPPAPGNNDCTGALSLLVNAGCVNTSTTSYAATQSQVGCTGTADDDVWFSFTANNYTQTIQVTASVNMDAVVELFSGSCGTLTSLYCEDNTFVNGVETITAIGLIPNATYYIRVYDYYSNGGYPFSICVSGNPIGVGQPNDEPCNALQLPAVTSICNYLQFSTVGATSTSTLLAPAPASCAGGSSPFMGGYSATTKDVWFKITVPSSGSVFISPQPNLGAGFINDGVMALYSGTSCSTLTQISCSDDYSGFPGSSNDLLPHISASGLTPGSTVYLRYWAFASAQGSFGLCIESPDNDNCSSSLEICDLNGYNASTSAAYSPDHPCNMLGNAEQLVGSTYNYVVGASPSAVFGLGGPWGVGSPIQNVYIDKNSWVKFTAASTSASFRINVGNCWVGNYPSGGIQMQIFSAASACCSFTPVSDFKEGSSTFTINANGLTVGNSYYLMIDGYAGDICNYSINALTGVSFANIAASNNSVCPGGSAVLTGPIGASSYTWLPSGSTSSVITVNPGSTITYTLIAEGVCGFKQTLTKQIVVNPLPTVLINAGSTITTCGTQTTTLIGSGASTYTWNTGPVSTTISVSPTVTTTYTVTGTSSQGCVNSTVATVTVNPLPTTSISASSATICSGSNATLTASGGNTYTWSTGSTNTIISVSPPSSTVYSVTATNTIGCSKTSTVNVGVVSLPTITSTSATICYGKSGTVTASGGASYVWSTSASTNSIVLSPTTTTNYTVIGTAANSCTNSAIAQVSVNALPIITVNSPTICSNINATLTAGGGNIYTWSTGASGPSIVSSPTINTSYTVTGTAITGCTNTAISSVTVLSIPQLASTPSVSPSNCSASTGSITNITVSGAPSLTYTWTNTSNAVVGSLPNLNTQPAGTYNLQVKDGNGCLNSFGPYNITNPGAPSIATASASASQVCVGGTINLFSSSSTSSVTFNWTGPNGFSSTAQNPVIPGATSLMTGIYTVYGTSAGCSGAPKTVSVIVNSNPTPVANSSYTSYCSGGTILLFASSASTYSWSGPNGFLSSLQNPTITPVSLGASGLYQLAVTNSANCSGATNIFVTVNSNPSVFAFATNTSVCSGSPIVLNASGGNTYVWSGPNGFNSVVQNPTISASSIFSGGGYSLTTTNTLTGCSTNTIVTVNINALPNFTAASNSSSICTNSPIQLTAAGNNITTYNWSGPASYTATGSTQTITNVSTSNSGNYTITVTDVNSCQSTMYVPVYIYALTSVTANAGATTNTYCTGNAINLQGSSVALSYNWIGPNSFTSSLQNPAINNAQINAGGIYTLTVFDVNNCSNSDTTAVLINTTPSLVSSNGGLNCIGQNIMLSANFGSSVAVNWFQDINLITPLASNTNTFIPNYGVYGTYTFYAQGLLNGCTSSVVPVVANYYNVVAGIGSSTLSGHAPLSVQFTNTSIGITTNNTVNWNFGDGNTTVNYNPSNVFSQPGTYTVLLTVANDFCSDTTQIVINVNIDELLIPEIFTPNGDGFNDVYHIRNLEFFPDNELQIFNRWGNIVYEMSGYKNDWNGTPNAPGKTGTDKLPTGTYFYLLKINGTETKVYRGFVQIVY